MGFRSLVITGFPVEEKEKGFEIFPKEDWSEIVEKDEMIFCKNDLNWKWYDGYERVEMWNQFSMGLDMYLSRRTIVMSGFHEHNKRTEDSFKELEVYGVDPGLVRTIEEEVGYWRNDDHIHQWFVDNVQEGEDDCQKYWVSKEDLTKLKQTCEEVLSDPSKKEKLLPTFDDSEYGEWYFDVLRNTIRIIDRIFENEKEFEKLREQLKKEEKEKEFGDDDKPPFVYRDYQYQSSW